MCAAADVSLIDAPAAGHDRSARRRRRRRQYVGVTPAPFP